MPAAGARKRGSIFLSGALVRVHSRNIVDLSSAHAGSISMPRLNRWLIAALFLCVLGLCSCGEKRAMREKPIETAIPPEQSPTERAPAPTEEAPLEAAEPGTRPAEAAEPETAAMLGEAPRVRVLILESRKAIRVRVPSSFSLAGGIGSGPALEVERGGDFTVRASGGEVVFAEGRKRLFSSDGVFVRPEGSEHVSVNGKPYRGAFLFDIVSGGLAAVNILDIDDYIKGVLPSEIGYLNADQFEAFRAQAIASRSYALSRLPDRSGEFYDLNATVMDQVYSGVLGEHADASRAVDESRGLVCTFLGQPLRAYYCSCCGGHTADIRVVWPWKTPYPYLYGVRDTVPEAPGVSLCRGSKHFRWRARWSGATLSAILRTTVPQELRVPRSSVGALTDVRVLGTGLDGRVTAIEIATERGSFQVRGDRIRWVLKPNPDSGAILRSTLFKLDVSRIGDRVASIEMLGGGNGHGVGMCQSGAIRMAELGYSGEAIIKHYYPGAKISLLYR
jgi:stage II sporulation protein D